MTDAGIDRALETTTPDNSDFTESGHAIRTVPQHVGQVHLTDTDGNVHNFVGPQSSPLVQHRDGGPYLDEGDAVREENRRRLVEGRWTVLGPNADPNVAYVAPNNSPTFSKLIEEHDNRVNEIVKEPVNEFVPDYDVDDVNEVDEVHDSSGPRTGTTELDSSVTEVPSDEELGL